MDPAPENLPEQYEIKRQLDRMLESKDFKPAPRLSDMLQYIVVNTLPDEHGQTDPTKLTEHQVGFNVLKPYDPAGSAVRANATALRGRIDTYYAGCGANDLVLIQVPAGGYRAAFSYNPRSPADKLYRRGCSLIAGFTPSENEHLSLRLFKEAAEADARHAPSYAARAEAELRETLYRRTIPPHNSLAAAEASAQEALRLQPKLWRAHVVLGVVRCCRREWQEAGKSFDAALALAPNATRDHAWYVSYLLATGKEEEALRLARSRADGKPDDFSAQIALGFSLYLARRFEEAEEFLCEVIGRFPNFWQARIVLACVYLARDRAGMALVNIEEAHEILSEQSDSIGERNVFPGLTNLCQIRGGDDGYKHLARESMKSADDSDYWAVYEIRHAAGEIPGDYDGWGIGHFDGYIPYWTPLQLALGFIGLEDKESAIAALTRAVEQGDPLTVLLPHLPLFDELRGDDAFESLVQRMSLPK